ncbi:hypothetical protein CPB86DRAFT_781131 [Serendipita vermifera]|nr:hypothetical protein CPB86DRAFT_781131 [Serendipita vermifera]
MHADKLIVPEASLTAAIPLPNAESCTFSTDYRLLTIFDLCNIEALNLNARKEASNFSMDLIPAHLTDLTLSCLKFITTTLTDDRPQIMPHIRSLTLNSIVLEGPLQTFFHLPNLKHLQISSTSSFVSINPEEETGSSKHAHRICSNTFFKGVPKLEVLSLQQMTVGSIFVSALRSCLSLKTPSLTNSRSEQFIPSFLESLTDVQAFPTLKSLNLNFFWSWPKRSGLTSKQFIDGCAARRPALSISVDNC